MGARRNELLLQLIIKTVDLATTDIEGVNAHVKKLQELLSGNEFDRSAEGMKAFGEAVKDATEPLALAAKNALALSAAMAGIASSWPATPTRPARITSPRWRTSPKCSTATRKKPRSTATN
ncbi:MAG: hypothetical protein IPI57_11860 [Candidatus Competibacteraceae bacterium]|nr:hypothetical protein [Candidatus Competibacteraceae bacterium]